MVLPNASIAPSSKRSGPSFILLEYQKFFGLNSSLPQRISKIELQQESMQATKLLSNYIMATSLPSNISELFGPTPLLMFQKPNVIQNSHPEHKNSNLLGM